MNDFFAKMMKEKQCFVCSYCLLNRKELMTKSVFSNSLTVIFLSLVLSSIKAYASDFGDAASKGVKLIVSSTSNLAEPNDIVVMNSPNASGISYNDVSLLTLNKPLKIINTGDAYGNSATQPASLIVIKSNSLKLYSSIEIVGQTADILLISPGANSTLACSRCSFKNVGRITLAAATASSLSPTMSAVGNLSNASNGTLSINSLNAAGVASLELIANSIATSGEINTQLRANFNSAGGYDIADNGGFVVGAGGVNMFARNLIVNYETLELKSAIQSTNTLAVNAKINSASIRITTASPLEIKSELSTQSDILTNTVYRNKMSAILEAIELKTLAPNPSYGHVYVNNTLKSDFLVTIKSAGDVYVNREISGKNVDLTVIGKLVNSNNINATDATMVADQIDNNGKVFSKNSVKMVANYALQNRFGGKIFANDISLASNFGLVRNGSQYRYRPANEGALVLRADANLDATTRLSTLKIADMNYAGAIKVSDLSAKIIGKKIIIDAQSNVENINPYYVYTKDPNAWANGIYFDGNAVDSVLLLADESLSIYAGQYVVNSSAVMGVNSPSSEKKFIITAPNISNERYFTGVQGDVVDANEKIVTDTSTITMSGSSLKANLYVYSPPGIIYSFAPLNFNLNNASGGFINNTAYFEALSDAHFAGVGKVTSVGLALQKENHNLVTTTVTRIRDCAGGIDPKTKEERPCKSKTETTTQGPQPNTTLATDMERTLFSVGGNLYGREAEYFGRDHQVLDDMKNVIINDFIATNTYSNVELGKGVTQLGSVDIYNNTTAQLSSTDPTKIIVVTETTYKKAGTSTVLSGGGYSTKTDVWTLVTAKLAQLKAAFLSAMDAFINWLNS
jgi:hypothetical protein